MNRAYLEADTVAVISFSKIVEKKMTVNDLDIANLSLQERFLGEPIDELLKGEQENIQKLENLVGKDKLAEIEKLDGDMKYDNIFLLRFVLTHKSKSGSFSDDKEALEAKDAILETLTWRKENLQVLKEVRATEIVPNKATFIKFQTVGSAETQMGGWPVFVVRTGYCNVKGLMNTLTAEEVLRYFEMSNYLQSIRCDTLTRQTKRLVKMINVIDMDSFSLFGGDKRFFKCLGESSKFSAVHFPQLLGKTVIVNAPSYFRLVFAAYAIFQPKRALEKQTVCPVVDSGSKIASVLTCPFVSKYGDVKTLPKFLGGEANTPTELVPIMQRSERTVVTVANRSKEVITEEIPTHPMTVTWSVMVKDYGIGVECKIKSENKEKVVFDYRKIKAEEGLVEGTFTIEQPGCLVITLDNSYSILRSKEVEYSFTVADHVEEKAEEKKEDMKEDA